MNVARSDEREITTPSDTEIAPNDKRYAIWMWMQISFVPNEIFMSPQEGK
jgi:hypothetical protein